MSSTLTVFEVVNRLRLAKNPPCCAVVYLWALGKDWFSFPEITEELGISRYLAADVFRALEIAGMGTFERSKQYRWLFRFTPSEWEPADEQVEKEAIAAAEPVPVEENELIENLPATGKNRPRTSTRPRSYARAFSQETREVFACKFDVFWANYPRKVGKSAAMKVFLAKTKGDLAQMDVIAESAKGFAERCAREKTEIRYIPHATTWLNQERWLDPAEETAPAAEQEQDYSWM